jgi:hypothetical protein
VNDPTRDEGEFPDLYELLEFERSEGPVIRVHGDAAGRLARIYSRANDIDRAMRCFDRLLLIGDHADEIDRYSLWSTGLIAYGRATLPDDRGRIDFSIFGKYRAGHDRLLRFRSQHIAHRDSPNEQDRLYLFVDGSANPPSHVIRHHTLMIVCPSSEAIEEDLDHMAGVREIFSDLIDEIRGPLLDAARAEPLDELLALADQRGSWTPPAERAG